MAIDLPRGLAAPIVTPGMPARRRPSPAGLAGASLSRLEFRSASWPLLGFRRYARAARSDPVGGGCFESNGYPQGASGVAGLDLAWLRHRTVAGGGRLRTRGGIGAGARRD